MTKLWRRITYLFRRNRLEAELAEEMEFHREQTARELGGDRAAASRALGNTTLAREDARGVWIVPWIESFWQDLSYAFRNMRRQKGFTMLALTTLALAIGLNTSLFTTFNAIALRPWPVKDPAAVVEVLRKIPQGPNPGIGGFGIAEYRYLAERSRAFAGLIVRREGERVRTGEQPFSLTYVSGNYFSVLGVAMERGRGFVPEEDRAGAPQAVVVLAYTTWQNRFGGDPAILGTTLRLDDVPFTVVGVTAREFTGTNPQKNDFWAPFPARLLLRPHDPTVMAFLTRQDYCCSPVAGRLAPGYTRAQAAAEIELLLKQFPGNGQEPNSTILLSGTAWVDPPNSKFGQVAPIIGLLFLAITMVLLLACANVGNLLLARAAARRTEIAVRLALGGSRLRLFRQLLVESMALAGCAALIGLAIAWFLPSYLVARLAPEFSVHLVPDWRVAAYTAALAIVACMAFGLAPALHGTRGEIAGAMKTGSSLASPLRLRGVLLAAQVAISVILLAGAGMMVRGLERAQRQNPAFAIDNVTVISLELPANAYGGKRTQAFARQLQIDLETSAGLPLVGVTKDAPLANSRSWTSMRRNGEPAGRDRMVAFHEVTAGYFDVLGIPVVEGRNFVSDDFARHVVILNQTAAKASWPGQSAVGQIIQSNGAAWEIVGVAKDAYTTDLNTVPPAMYWPMTGRFDIPQVLVRGGPAAVEQVAAVVTRLDPKARIHAAPLQENFRALLQPARYGAALAGALGMLALALASIGMSGVFAYVVRQRTREIGVRMALGASQWQVVRLVLASNLRALFWGMGIGLAGAAALSRVLIHQVSQITAADPVAYAGVFLLLALAAVAAGAFPARRAARVDPVRALRWE